MKQFVLVKSLVTTGKVSEMADGAMAFVNKGSDTAVASDGVLDGELNIVVKEGEYLNYLPVYKNKARFNLSKPAEATAYSVKITLNSGVYKRGVYTLIIAKKGVPFNERNKWSIDTFNASEGSYADNIAEALVAQINKLSFVEASLSSNVITITAIEKGIDYTVKLTDGFNLVHITKIEETNAQTAQNDVEAIVDLYNKCAADRGINYTYSDTQVYPNLPFNPLKGSDSEDKGFYILNLSFAEPRVTKTTDEVVNQMIHIVTANETVANNIKAILAKVGTEEFPNAYAQSTTLED